VRQLDEGDGVLVLTDIYGATPGNIALRLLVPGKSRESPASTCRC